MPSRRPPRRQCDTRAASAPATGRGRAHGRRASTEAAAAASRRCGTRCERTQDKLTRIGRRPGRRAGFAVEPAALARDREDQAGAGGLRLKRSAGRREGRRRHRLRVRHQRQAQQRGASIRRTGCSGRCGRSSCAPMPPKRSARRAMRRSAAVDRTPSRRSCKPPKAARSSEKKLPLKVRLETRDSDKALYSEVRRADGSWVHRSYLAK